MHTVLIVDDDPAMATAMAFALSAKGLVVETAEDGLAAFACAQRVHPSVVVTDWLMPRADGAVLCHLLLADAGLRDTPIVICTSCTPQPVIDNPTVRYCPKPCPVDALVHTVCDLIDEAARP
ncbi:response regulator [Cupriavidus respiraculi]|uniref:Response regulator MprA n=1 Tax=Cupriavidus respiraculi TaxID=195930 RepID=A0ABN7YYX9_9BURK|nr:response regulator [Cupriavidus respiraculi]MBY4949945.1 response regulator [Cupriavidus respiraculi]CAG9178924.1 Response regulator MprA [Cupriavidus respiraculi]